MLEEGRAHRERTGESLMVSRYDIVPIPAHLRGHVIEKSSMQMPVETAQSMYDFRAEDMIGRIAPRPVLLMHSSVDSVTPTSQTIEMFKRAGSPTDMHLFSGTDHFMFAEHNLRVHEVVTSWLATFFPVHGAPAAPAPGH
jgi:alpha-beta hydrolase superfamily lysophospholipase